MGSDNYWLMEICYGLAINADKNQKSIAYANKNYFEHP